MTTYSRIANASFAPETRVIVRTDFNVPIRAGFVSDDFKLRRSLPTIDHLLRQGCIVTLISHFGRPESFSSNPAYSLAPVAEWFSAQGRPLRFTDNLDSNSNRPLTLLENVRLWSGEKKNDLEFASRLKKDASVFVHDAFGAVHNHDTSLTLLPSLFPLKNRYAGFLLDEELSFFQNFLPRARGNCLLIVAGAKIDKLERLFTLLSVENPIPSVIAIGGRLVESFIKNAPIAQEIRYACSRNNIELIIPTHAVLDNGPEQELTPENASRIVDIGAQAVEKITAAIKRTKYVIANCVVGKKKDATQVIIKALAESGAEVAITGGESAREAHFSPYSSRIKFISTGGGAVLALLAHPDNFNELASLHILSEQTL